MSFLKTRSGRIFCAGLGLAVNLPALADGTPDGSWGHHGMMWNGGSGMWFMGTIMMLLFLAAAVAIVVLVVRSLGGHGPVQDTHSARGSSALRILEERFARGEIDEEEFRKRKDALERH